MIRVYWSPPELGRRLFIDYVSEVLRKCRAEEVENEEEARTLVLARFSDAMFGQWQEVGEGRRDKVLEVCAETDPVLRRTGTVALLYQA